MAKEIWYKAWRVTQPGTLIATDKFFKCGFRPTKVVITSLTAAGTDGIAVRGLGGAADNREILIISNGSSAAASAATTGDQITWADDGFTLGQSTSLFHVASKVMLVEAFADAEYAEAVTLDSTLPLRANAAFGSGDAYDASINADGSGAYDPTYSDAGIYRTS